MVSPQHKISSLTFSFKTRTACFLPSIIPKERTLHIQLKCFNPRLFFIELKRSFHTFKSLNLSITLCAAQQTFSIGRNIANLRLSDAVILNASHIGGQPLARTFSLAVMANENRWN
jgi:hypothetical protein